MFGIIVDSGTLQNESRKLAGLSSIIGLHCIVQIQLQRSAVPRTVSPATERRKCLGNMLAESSDSATETAAIEYNNRMKAQNHPHPLWHDLNKTLKAWRVLSLFTSGVYSIEQRCTSGHCV